MLSWRYSMFFFIFHPFFTLFYAMQSRKKSFFLLWKWIKLTFPNIPWKTNFTKIIFREDHNSFRRLRVIFTIIALLVNAFQTNPSSYTGRPFRNERLVNQIFKINRMSEEGRAKQWYTLLYLTAQHRWLLMMCNGKRFSPF